MRFETSQSVQLGQHMKLAPRMIQSMEILQMALPALQERIEQELEANIALEQGTADGELELDREVDDEHLAEALDEREMVVDDDPRNDSEDWERLSVLESSYGEAFDNQYSSARAESGERDRKLDAMANIAARGESLTEQLQHQWAFAEVDEPLSRAGSLLIEHIDDDGILASDFESILEQHRDVPGQALDEALLERALDAVQQHLEPPGIGARSKRECLLLQIDYLELADEDETHDWDDVRLLIESHFEDLLENRQPKIAQESGLSLDRIAAAMALMKRLDLSPARGLVEESVPHIVPDVIVERNEQTGRFEARLTDGTVPPLRLSQRYLAMARDKKENKETRSFVTKNVRNARWLIEAIQQRQATLLRVVNAMLARQQEYFEHGPQYLKPLPMVDVADQLGVHVATVSRAVADKWLETPRGLVSLRKFFSGGTATGSGREMSWEAVRATLQEIVDAEDRKRPFSDEALAAELGKRGIEIARRTVVKYRQQLGIPPARRRKVFNGG